VDFRILGPLEVLEHGRALPLGARKVRGLLALLLVRANEVVATDHVVDALWESPPATAAKSVHVYVSQLRKTIGPQRLLTRSPGYVLRVGPEELDAVRFERLLAQARASEPARAGELLRQALSLFRGPALADFAYEGFAQAESARLEELRLAALEERLAADLAIGRDREIVPELEALVAREPLREKLRAQLMLALYRCGRQAAALEAYQEARRALVEQLGIEPGRDLQQLQQAILNQDQELGRPQEAAVLERTMAPTEVVPSAPPPPDERKVVTILFADLVESTALGEQDPERTRALLERFYDAMGAEIEAAGGTVEKFAGDAVLAAFGAPAAQEDHAERALHTALAMRRRLSELVGEALELRIGVNTGVVIAARPRGGSSFLTGDPVNVAARLEQAAAPGEILVGETTATAVGGAFALGPCTTVEAKGKLGGIAARRLERAVSRTRPRGVAGLASVFVGRENELELLEATFRRLTREGEPHLVSVLGEVGVGKTSLVGRFSERVETGSLRPLRMTGRCLAYGRGITYFPLAEILRERLGLLQSDPPEAVRERLGENAILGLTLGLEVPELPPVVAQEQLHRAWIGLVNGIVAERPAVLVVEDLHWAEEPLLDLLERLVREVSGPLILLATARPELLDRRPAWGAGQRNAATIWLEPLARSDASRLVATLLPALHENLRDAVLERAEGNPFFVEELIGALLDEGAHERTDGDPAPPELLIPASVHAVLAARIDRLPAPAKAALQAAAVVGRTFWTAPVRELLGGVALDLGLLEERDFIKRRPTSTIEGETEYSFKHQVTREVAYTSLPKSSRPRLHASLAEWLERFGDGRDEHAPLLAHHYAEAARPENADLAWPGEDERLAGLRAKACSWLARAADLADGRYALDEEIALLRRAIALETSAPARTELWRRLARASLLKYDQKGFREAMLEVIAEAEPGEAAESYSQLAFWDAFRWGHSEDRESIERWIERALALAPPASAARARALVARSYCRPEEAEDAAAEASSIAERLPDIELRSYAFRARVDSALALGRYDEAREWAERRLELLDQIEDPDHVADVYWSAIPGYLGRGRFDDARRLAALHDEVTSGLSPHHKLHGVAFRLEIEELAGRWDLIRELTPRAEGAVRASTPCIHQPRSLLVCALGAAYLGEATEALRLEAEADSLGVEDYGRAFDPRIRLALLHGDIAAAERLLVEADRPRKTLIRSAKLAPVTARLDALAALGRAEDVEAEAVPLLRPDTYLEPFALRALGLVRPNPAFVEEAAGRFEAMELDWHARQTRELLGTASGFGERERFD
jgi:DNA-binding SARP family transcriptional activator